MAQLIKIKEQVFKEGGIQDRYHRRCNPDGRASLRGSIGEASTRPERITCHLSAKKYVRKFRLSRQERISHVNIESISTSIILCPDVQSKVTVVP